MMTSTHVRARRTGLVVSIAAVLGFSVSVVADPTADYEKLAKDKSPAFVTVKFVLKTEGAFDEGESESEAAGIMIDPAGLVLCANASLGGGYGRYGGARPTDLKVLIGKDTEGLPARLVARDSELDLAWVQIKEPGKGDFAYIDFGKAAVPKLGERMLGLHKMGKYFDRAVVISEGRVAGRTKKPRELIVPGGDLATDSGLPVFAEDGSVVGVFVSLELDEADREEEFNDGSGESYGGFDGMILSSAEVVKATKQAMEPKPEDDRKDKAAPTKAGDKVEASDKGDGAWPAEARRWVDNLGARWGRPGLAASGSRQTGPGVPVAFPQPAAQGRADSSDSAEKEKVPIIERTRPLENEFVVRGIGTSCRVWAHDFAGCFKGACAGRSQFRGAARALRTASACG